MKVLDSIVSEKDTNVKYPFGANVQNETDTVSGTPIVRGVYSEMLMNMYRVMELTNVTPNDIEDDKDTQFQLVEAFKKLPNSLNDIEQVLQLTGSVWSVPFDLSILPNKYFFIARASNDYVGGAYTFKGTGVLELPFSSTGFDASDEVLVIIDSLGVRAYSLSKLSATPEFLTTLASSPIRYSSGSDLYYFDSGKLFKNLQVWDLQNSIRVDQSDGALVLQNVFFMQGYAVCVVKNPATLNYEFYAFDLLDLNTVIVLATDIIQTPSVDFLPEFYTNGFDFYATNGCNRNSDDFKFTELVFDGSLAFLNESTNLDFDASFVKNSNGTAIGNFLYLLNSGEFSKFDVYTGVKTTIGNFPTLSGYLFSLNNTLYLNQNNIANKLNV